MILKASKNEKILIFDAHNHEKSIKKLENRKLDAIYRDKRNKRMVQSPIHASKTSIHRGIDAFYQIAEKPKHQKSEKLALLMQRAR